MELVLIAGIEELEFLLITSVFLLVLSFTFCL